MEKVMKNGVRYWKPNSDLGWVVQAYISANMRSQKLVSENVRCKHLNV